jgi:hypothetical protein
MAKRAVEVTSNVIFSAIGIILVFNQVVYAPATTASYTTSVKHAAVPKNYFKPEAFEGKMP